MRTSVVAKLLNTLEQFINPATEEKQDDIITAINNVSGLQRATNLEGGGKISVGTTAVEVSFSGTPTESVIITADNANSGLLYIGKSNVTNAGANAITFLEAGDSVTIDYDDATNAIYVVSDTASQYFWKGVAL
uniref:Uncharacterized protein n=1 Tax=viral metagenome TaxID=1070528 RepID=A0A6M3LAA5_9ZZZZ